MWNIIRENGTTIGERDCEWPKLPHDIKIATLVVGGHLFEGAEAYGFQRFSNVKPGSEGAILGMDGFQVLLRNGDHVSIWELARRGYCLLRVVPASSSTYNPALWRNGVPCAV